MSKILTRALIRGAYRKPKKLPADLNAGWGLGPCLYAADCPVCAIGREQVPSELRRLRDFYIVGTPLVEVCEVFAVSKEALYRHAKSIGWDRRRMARMNENREEVFWNIAQHRYLLHRDMATDDTPDKMLGLMAKVVLAGKGKEQQVTEVGVRWEDRLVAIRMRTAGQQHALSSAEDEAEDEDDAEDTL